MGAGVGVRAPEGPLMDYPYIKAWGEQLGSSSWYISNLMHDARKDKAPPDVFYRSAETGRWVRWKDFNGSPLTRDAIERRVAQLLGTV